MVTSAVGQQLPRLLKTGVSGLPLKSAGPARDRGGRVGPKVDTHYSSTTSARTKNFSGMTRPMAFAVLRLTANSNFVGCSIGRAFGSLPRNIRSTYFAPCRNAAGPSAPKDISPPASTNARLVEAVGNRYLIAISVTNFVAKLP